MNNHMILIIIREIKIIKIIILTTLYFFQIFFQVWSYKLQSVNNNVQL
jgi:hypothetical protein